MNDNIEKENYLNYDSKKSNLNDFELINIDLTNENDDYNYGISSLKSSPVEQIFSSTITKKEFLHRGNYSVEREKTEKILSDTEKSEFNTPETLSFEKIPFCILPDSSQKELDNTILRFPYSNLTQKDGQRPSSMDSICSSNLNFSNSIQKGNESKLQNAALGALENRIITLEYHLNQTNKMLCELIPRMVQTEMYLSNVIHQENYMKEYIEKYLWPRVYQNELFINSWGKITKPDETTKDYLVPSHKESDQVFTPNQNKLEGKKNSFFKKGSELTNKETLLQEKEVQKVHEIRKSSSLDICDTETEDSENDEISKFEDNKNSISQFTNKNFLTNNYSWENKDEHMSEKNAFGWIIYNEFENEKFRNGGVKNIRYSCQLKGLNISNNLTQKRLFNVELQYLNEKNEYIKIPKSLEKYDDIATFDTSKSKNYLFSIEKLKIQILPKFLNLPSKTLFRLKITTFETIKNNFMLNIIIYYTERFIIISRFRQSKRQKI